MGHLGHNNVHPQQFTDNYVKNFSVKVKKNYFFFARNMRRQSEFLEFKKENGCSWYFGLKIKQIVPSLPRFEDTPFVLSVSYTPTEGPFQRYVCDRRRLKMKSLASYGKFESRNFFRNHYYP